MILKRNTRYLQIALNSTLEEAEKIIGQLPFSDRILVEAGTPLIKAYGAQGIKKIKIWWVKRVFDLEVTGGASSFFREAGIDWAGQFLGRKKEIVRPQMQSRFLPYVVADIKCSDLGTREVRMAAEAGADAATCLGVAPEETIDFFINNRLSKLKECSFKHSKYYMKFSNNSIVKLTFLQFLLMHTESKNS